MTPDRWHDDMEQLLGVYAVDAVDDDERQAVAHHLGRCRSCAAEVSGHWEVAARLTVGGPPPCGGWDRISGDLEEAPPPLELAPRAGRLPGRRARWPLAALTAVAAAAALFLGVRVTDQDRRLAGLQTAMADDGLRRSAVAALVDPAAQRLALTSAAAPAVVQAAILPDGRGYLVADQLPRLARDRTYQLWVLIGNERVSAGILGSRPVIAAFHVGQRLDGLAVTEERSGGVIASENAPVVFGRVARS